MRRYDQSWTEACTPYSQSGGRLREAGVSFEDRQDLLGHRSGRVTTHYSADELSKLIDAANLVAQRN